MDHLSRLYTYCPIPQSTNVSGNLQESLRTNVQYGAEFLKLYPGFANKPLRVAFGDNTARFERPTIVKSRCIGDANGVLLPLHQARHWSMTPEMVHAQDVPWHRKRMAVVWRGATTGKSRSEDFQKHPRTLLVQRWHGCQHQGIDVAYSQVVQGKESLAPLVRNELSLREQLQFALIVCVEGNDVATNLKWVLASNSVPVMPPPRYETWLLESHLRPMIHYVPVRPDFEDLHAMLDWCRCNPERCKAIAAAGQRYVAPFFADPRAEHRLAVQVLRRYLAE